MTQASEEMFEVFHETIQHLNQAKEERKTLCAVMEAVGWPLRNDRPIMLSAIAPYKEMIAMKDQKIEQLKQQSDDEWRQAQIAQSREIRQEIQ